jgi:hypothetical protein
MLAASRYPLSACISLHTSSHPVVGVAAHDELVAAVIVVGKVGFGQPYTEFAWNRLLPVVHVADIHRIRIPVETTNSCAAWIVSSYTLQVLISSDCVSGRMTACLQTAAFSAVGKP